MIVTHRYGGVATTVTRPGRVAVTIVLLRSRCVHAQVRHKILSASRSKEGRVGPAEPGAEEPSNRRGMERTTRIEPA